MQEEELYKEQQRQNFNNMVEAARLEAAQKPPPPYDPMRFRAVPPGESHRLLVLLAAGSYLILTVSSYGFHYIYL